MKLIYEKKLTIDVKDSSDVSYAITGNSFEFRATGVGAHGRCEYSFQLSLFVGVELEKRTPQVQMDAITQRILNECRTKSKTKTDFISDAYYNLFWQNNANIIKIATVLQLTDVAHAR
uniref:Uncharacterized protein n=1 Tax=Wuchereria bancrofti TaxID=6293 RepID=A0AAF5Q5E3_WUCBA